MAAIPSSSPTRPAGHAPVRKRMAQALHRPVDIASLAAFRILFGLLMAAGAVRFLLSGWIPRFYDQHPFLFKYWGFGWLPVAPLWAIYALYAALAVLALLMAAGLFYRISVALFLLGFTYAQLLDVTNYLNHYYLVVLLCAIMLLLPLHRAWSLDAWRKPALRARTLPAWNLYLLRFQIAVVYVFAGLAKLGSDWLLHAQPLHTWLSARTEMPLIGPWLDELWVAYAFSWAGFLYDTTIVLFLSMRRTRAPAYVVVLCFHTMTALLFNIGMFPFIMTLSALVFFAPDWPRRRLPGRLIRRLDGMPLAAQPAAAPSRPGHGVGHRLGMTALGAYCALQVLIPLRHYLYPGNVLWNEEGMRFSWKVMVREKHGSVTYYVRFPDSGKELQVTPRQYLDSRQEREMAGQPDLILQLARRIAEDFRARGMGEVEVRAEALVSLNGRPAQHMIDPTRDLARVQDGLLLKRWLLPAPHTPPTPGQAFAGR